MSSFICTTSIFNSSRPALTLSPLTRPPPPPPKGDPPPDAGGGNKGQPPAGGKLPFPFGGGQQQGAWGGPGGFGQGGPRPGLPQRPQGMRPSPKRKRVTLFSTRKNLPQDHRLRRCSNADKDHSCLGSRTVMDNLSNTKEDMAMASRGHTDNASSKEMRRLYYICVCNL